MICYVLQSLCALFMPYVMSDIVEEGIRNGDMTYILTHGAIMAALALGALIIALFTNKITAKFYAEFDAETRRQIVNKVNRLDFEQFSQIGAGGLITRCTEDVDWIQDAVGSAPYILINTPTMFIGGIVLSFRGDWLLPLIFLGIALAALSVAVAIAVRMDKLWEKGGKYIDVQNRVIRERLTGIRVVRAFGKDRYEHERAAHAINTMNNSFVRANTVSGLISPIISFLLNFATVVVIYVGAARLQNSETLKAGDVLATVQYIALILNAILTLSWSVTTIPHVKVSMRRISEIMDMETAEEQTYEPQVLEGEISFENVSFTYEGAKARALSNVNFCAKQGEIVGIIGGTGSGKTTLIKLLLDFYPAESGSRFFGGKSYESAPSAVIRDNISVALQKSMIFEGTIAENVKMGNADATDEEVKNALEIARMSNFVESKPEGVNYMLSQYGNNISGGQKQRVNIARAILKPASVYIFDDSFSALDYLTEAQLRKQLNKFLQNKTQIIVTQRAATAMRCDKVYVLDRGKVVGVGTHKQLLQTCPTYREIYNSQMGGDMDA